MSRRQFFKWLFGAAIVLFGGAALWRRLLYGLGGGTRAAGATEATEPAANTASTAPTSPPPASSPTPHGKGDLLLSFFLLSDLHISVDEQSMTDKLKGALNDLGQFDSKVEAIVFGGDLTDFGRESDYTLLKKTLAGFTLPPMFGNMGNHDYYHVWLTESGAFSQDTVPNGKTDAQARERFMHFVGYSDKPYTDTYVNGVHILMLSQEVYMEERPQVKEGAWYSDEQLAWLADKMKEHQNGKPVLIMIHQPLPPSGDGGTHQLIRATEFRRILKPYKNVFVFSGHTHRDLNEPTGHYMHESFHWFVNASVGRTRVGGGSVGKLAQGMYIQVYENELVVRGREFSDRTWIGNANWSIPFERT